MAIPVNRIVTTAHFPGREIGESLGIVGAECVLGINIFKDIMGGMIILAGYGTAVRFK